MLQKIRMDRSFEIAVREIITKEDEHHLQIKSGLIKKDELIHSLFTDPKIQEAWEHQPFVFKLFREKVIQTAHIILSTRFQKDFLPFYEWLGFFYKKALRDLRNKFRETETIDREIKTSPRTIAFKDSGLVLSDMIGEDISRFRKTASADDVKILIRSACEIFYPIDISTLDLYLKKNDPAFWKELDIVMYKILEQIVFYHPPTGMEPSDLSGETWEKACEQFRKHVLSAPPYESGTHLRYSMKKTAGNTTSNYFRNKKNQLNDFDFISGYQDVEPEESGYQDDAVEFDAYSNIHEIRQALVASIYLEKGKWFEMFSSGASGRIEILKYRTIDGLSYDDIVRRIHGENLSPEESSSLNTAMRKEMSRLIRKIREWTDSIEKQMYKTKKHAG